MNMDWILECCPEYEILIEFDNIENKDKKEIHGLKERGNTRCIFLRSLLIIGEGKM